MYSTAFLLFISPTKQPNILNLLVHRSTGEQIFGGTAKVEASKANFSICSISRPGGFPVNVEGSFEGGNLNFGCWFAHVFSGFVAFISVWVGFCYHLGVALA